MSVRSIFSASSDLATPATHKGQKAFAKDCACMRRIGSRRKSFEVTQPFPTDSPPKMASPRLPGQQNNKRNLKMFLKILKGLWKHPQSWPFRGPPDPKTWGNLAASANMIKEPINLKIIKERLDSNYYSSGAEAIQDLKTMFSNCYMCCTPGDKIFQMGKSLEKFFEALIKGMPKLAKLFNSDTSKDVEERKRKIKETDFQSNGEKFIKLENGERSHVKNYLGKDLEVGKRKMDSHNDRDKFRKLENGDQIIVDILKKEVKEENEIHEDNATINVKMEYDKNEDSWYNSVTFDEKHSNDSMSDKGHYFHGKIIKIINENYGIFAGYKHEIGSNYKTTRDVSRKDFNIELFLFDVCDVWIGQKNCNELGKSLSDVMKVGEKARIHGVFIDYADAKNKDVWKVECLATALIMDRKVPHHKITNFPERISRKEISQQKIENFNTIQKFLIGVDITEEEKRLLEGLNTETQSQVTEKHHKRDKTESPTNQHDKNADQDKWDDLFERDVQVLARREKQLDYGKNTSDYDDYLKHVPKDARTDRMPRTPNRFKKYNRRQWDGMVKAWKVNIHTAAGIINSGHNYLDVSQDTERMGN